VTADPDATLRETLVEREYLYRGRVDFMRDRIVDANGQRHEREVVNHPGAVAMVAIRDDDHVLLVRQWRHAVGRALLEIPAGTLDVDAAGSAEEPALAAARELTEETGYRAGKWRALGSFFTAPGFASEEMFLFLAYGLEPVAGYAGPAEDERLELEPVAWPEAVALARRGEIRDAKTLVGLLTVDALRDAGELAELPRR
jgi:8-oxo-dGTP pyrophosphatase MutT (NUDIX family)